MNTPTVEAHAQRTGLETLSDADFAPVRRHRQSTYSAGLCERCDTPIAAGELHESRAWLHGPAEFCQHITCPSTAELELAECAGIRCYILSADEARERGLLDLMTAVPVAVHRAPCKHVRAIVEGRVR